LEGGPLLLFGETLLLVGGPLLKLCCWLMAHC
jgi:hypothetical protein